MRTPADGTTPHGQAPRTFPQVTDASAPCWTGWTRARPSTDQKPIGNDTRPRRKWTPICAWPWSARGTSLHLIGALGASWVRDAVGNAAALPGRIGLDGRPARTWCTFPLVTTSAAPPGTTRTNVRLACKQGRQSFETPSQIFRVTRCFLPTHLTVERTCLFHDAVLVRSNA